MEEINKFLTNYFPFLNCMNTKPSSFYIEGRVIEPDIHYILVKVVMVNLYQEVEKVLGDLKRCEFDITTREEKLVEQLQKCVYKVLGMRLCKNHKKAMKGILKQLTSGNPIQSRGWAPPMISFRHSHWQ